MHYGLALGGPVGLDDAAGTDYGHHVRVDRRHRIQQLLLHRRDADVGTVQPFALAGFIQTNAQNHDISQFCLRHGFLQIRLVGLAAALVTGTVTNQIPSCRFGGIRQAVHFGGVHHTGTGALIARRDGKIPDQGHFFTGLQGQDAVFVFQQNNALCSRFSDQLVVDRFIEFPGCFPDRFVRGKHQIQQFIHTGVNGMLADLPIVQRLPQPAGSAQARRGHFQRGAVPHALHMVVGAAPVGDHSTIKAPLFAQDVQQQVFVLVGVHAVHLIVRGHDGFWVSFLDHDFKGGQVQFPQGALIQNGVACHAAQFLTVGGKMLGTGRHTGGLDAAHITGGQFAGKIGILGEILKAAAAQRAALDVQTGAEQDVDPVSGRFFAQCSADFFAQGRIPTVCHGGGSREAGSGFGGIQAQVVGRAGLLAQAVGAIGQPNGGHPLPGVRLGLPGVFAGQQRAFLLDGQFGNDVLMFHGKAPFDGNGIAFGSRTTPKERGVILFPKGVRLHGGQPHPVLWGRNWNYGFNYHSTSMVPPLLVQVPYLCAAVIGPAASTVSSAVPSLISCRRISTSNGALGSPLASR